MIGRVTVVNHSQAGPPAHQSPSVKPQTLDPQLSLQQFQVKGAGWMVNRHCLVRVAHAFDFRVASSYLEA